MPATPSSPRGSGRPLLHPFLRPDCLCRAAGLCLLAALAQLPALAAEGDGTGALDSAPGEWRDITPAPDLRGWTRIAIPPKNALGRAQWHGDAARGILVCDGDGGHEMLRFDRELTDCTFHVEFRFVPVPGKSPHYNSGIFIRNSADGTIWHQCQLTPDGGYLFGNTPAGGKVGRFKLAPSERRMKPAGEWNAAEVTARGRVLTVWLNGAIVSEFRDCEVASGYIALESEGFAIEFRGLRLRELPPGAP